MEKPDVGFEIRRRFLPFILIISSVSVINVHSQSSSNDAAVMQALKKNLQPLSSLDWSDPNPCNWNNVKCSKDNRVTGIQLGHQNLKGNLPQTLNNLTQLQVLEFQHNQLTGPLPSLSGLTQLHNLLLNNNNFSSIPIDFFDGMSSLQNIYLDYNAFTAWSISENLKTASNLRMFSATSTNLTGKIPDFFGADTFSGLITLRLASNSLEGRLPDSFSGSSIQSLWLNGQKSTFRLNGSIDVLQNMTQLTEVWLHTNSFSGPLPDFSGLNKLQNLSLRDNSFTGPVPPSLLSLKSLKTVNLTKNMLQGPTPKFNDSVAVDMIGIESFCLPNPGVPCDSRVNTLLTVAESVGYPRVFANNWKDNNLTGVIPNELKDLPNLIEIDVSNNHLSGQIPSFRENVKVKTEGNTNIGKDDPTVTAIPPSNGVLGSGGTSGKTPGTLVVVGSVIGGVCVVFLAGLLAFCVYKAKKNRSSSNGPGNPPCQHTMVIHPRHSGSDGDGFKITIAGQTNAGGSTETNSHHTSGDVHIVETGNMVISIQVLRNVTNNFSPDNILGKGGFGTVYKGELHDGTKIAVKRMESGVMSETGITEFQSEISVLTKVRHRHLVALLGYCLDGNERLLVYEYMPQGTLSRFLFNKGNEDLKPLLWSKRLVIALDVARGVEYLHGLAQQSFIHRDLKPSNILLGDDFRAKVADFGLVRLAPDGKGSIATRLAGTFGYLAPEYAVTGRVTTKVDVFSFGVILMELITGRQALDETQPEESVHLVQWFKKMHINNDTFRNAIDPSLELDEDGLASVTTVAELAGHCCAREPYQRPDMSHAVNVLSSLAELWKPSEPDPDDVYGIDLNTSLSQVVKKWQAMEGISGFDHSIGNTQTSIPIGPSGFGDSFMSHEGR
ncbi:unnamed protein product [Lactuca virosa]|uniref:Protein kinase domain-containing protein n=1 Tax=Lactuca virosa TaxID=75947 RepID=A0AAU9M796_9ASTR|nr:unnamed protein product [Lactuca virosa]